LGFSSAFVEKTVDNFLEVCGKRSKGFSYGAQGVEVERVFHKFSTGLGFE
jgi:hypothetical protein